MEISTDLWASDNCLVICAIQLLTPNNLGGTFEDIQSISVLELLSNHALQINIYLLMYFSDLKTTLSS